MVIYLNGPINAGKTTVAKLLAAMIPRAVHIEIDDLPVPASLSLDESIKSLLHDAADLARRWHERGFHAIVGWPISAEDHRQFVHRLAGVSVHTFTLAPRMEATLTNRGTRELTDWERQRIQFHYAQGIHRPTFGTVFDNSNESPGHTAQRIIDMLRDRGEIV